MQAVDKLHYHSSSMLQAVPVPWTDHTVPATMDFTYDGVYNSFTSSAYNTFPSVLSQTLCELDIDNSIHKLFEGLPEILEDHSTGHRDMEVPGRDPVVTVASPYFPSTPPEQGSKPSSMCCTGSTQKAVGVTFMTGPLAGRNNAYQQQQPEFLRPKPASQESAPVTVQAVNRKGARARKGKGTGRSRIDAKVPSASQSSGKNVVDAIVPSIQPPPRLSVHVATVVPKILPATAISAVNLLSFVKADEHAAPVHPLHLGEQAGLRMLKRSRKDPAQTASTRTQKTRYFDKVEHIVRERWRRDDMAGKFLALESLLPPSSKRDRSTIVEDSMKLVKSLQHRKEDAMKRRSELKLAVASGHPSPGLKLNQFIQKLGSLAVIPHANLQSVLESGSPSSSSMAPSSGLTSTKRPLEAVAAPDDSVQIPKLLSDTVKRFYVHSELSSGDMAIEMICEQVPNSHSILLKSMEALGLEVIRCSVTKTSKKLIYNITVKPFPFSASANLSSTSIMEGLSSAFRKV